MSTATRRAAPAGRRVRRQAAFETGVLLRNGEQLLVAIILPALALFGLHLADVPDLGSDRIRLVAPGVLALAVASTAFTGQAISTAFDRRNGVLRLLGTTPLGRGGLVGGKMIATSAVLAIHLVVLAILAAALGWRPEARGILPGVVTIVLGEACFVALALAVAGRMRAEAVLAVANLVWVLFLGLGLLLPTRILPSGLAGVARVLPSGALGDALRMAFADGHWPFAQWGVLVTWLALGAVVTARTFRWSD
ncbi:MAG: ABC transporter permease [Dermatophilaceae bacterium]